jgi:hypothetical protein
MEKLYRHGEIGFLVTEKIPSELAQSKTDVIMKGSHGNDHTFNGGKLFLLDKMKGFVFGYFISENTKLFHTEHSPNGEAMLPNGNYQLLKQQEFTPEGLVPVID